MLADNIPPSSDLNSVSLVFINSTCFDHQIMQKLADKCSQLETGTFMLTLTKKIPSDAWECLLSVKRKMSWGMATIHI